MNRFDYISLLIFAILCSCERDVTYSVRDVDDRMVINGIFRAGDAHHEIEIGRSECLFNHLEDDMGDAHVTVSVNNETIPVSRDERDRTLFSFDCILSEKDKVIVTADAAGLHTVTGTAVMPEPPCVKDVQTEWSEGEIDALVRIKIHIQDIRDERNYYRITVKSRSVYKMDGMDTDWRLCEVLYDYDPVFAENRGFESGRIAHSFGIFSDSIFQGREYTLNVCVRQRRGVDSWTGIEPERYLKVELESLSQSYYNYLRSIELSQGTDYFSEPVKIYSNIDNGFGILGCYAVTSIVVRI